MKRPLMAACLAITAGIMLHMADAYIIYIVCIMAAAIIAVIGSNKMKHQDKKIILMLFLCAVGGYIWTGIPGESLGEKMSENNVQDIKNDNSEWESRNTKDYSKNGYSESDNLYVEDMEVYIKSIKEFDDGYTFIGKSGGVKYLIYNDNSTDAAEFSEGKYICVTGKAKPIPAATNPGAFDKRKYYGAKGIKTSINADRVTMSDRTPNYFAVAVFKLRKYLKSSIECIFPEKYSGILAAMLLGERDSMDAATKALYRENGIAHILAISALHVALIAGFFMKMLEIFGMAKKKRAIVAMAFVIFYAFLTGLSPSTVRAAIMLILTYIAMIKGRTPDPFTSITLTLVLSVFADVSQITDNGLVMSFVAGSAVIVGGLISEQVNREAEKKIEEKMEKYRGRLPGRKNKIKSVLVGGIDTVIMSVVINIFMLPVIIYYYYEITPYALFLNFIIIPLLTVAVAFGAVGMMFGAVGMMFGAVGMMFGAAGTMFGAVGTMFGAVVSMFEDVGKGLSYPARLVIDLYEWLCEVTIKLPFSRVITGCCELKWVIAYYIFLGIVLYLWLSRNLKNRNRKNTSKNSRNNNNRSSIDRKNSNRKNIIAPTIMIIISLIFMVTVKLNNHLTTKVAFLDVGQGDSSIIHTDDGLSIISDSGSSSVTDIGKNVLVPALKYYGMGRVTHVFISHFDEDHVSGIFYLLENYELSGIKIDEIVVADGTEDEKLEELKKLAYEHDIKVVYASSGDKLVKGKTKIDVIYPFGSDTKGNAEEQQFGDAKQRYGEEKQNDDGEINTGNEYSLCFKFSYRNLSVLYTGDIGSETEQRIMEKYSNSSNISDISNDSNIDDAIDSAAGKTFDSCFDNVLNSTVLKVPHHGSKYSSSEEFIKAISPSYAVISVGRNNLYGHPAPETQERLEKHGIRIYRTDETGAVIIE